jgi:hypothetical protein
MDIILIDQYTKNIPHWNPFEEYKDINFFKDIKTYYILAPKNNDNETYIWNFKITYRNENEIMLNTIKNSINSDPCIDIFIKNGIGKINYINKCNNHKGKDLIKWTIEIIKHLGCNKCILNDQAEKKCSRRQFKNYVSLSLIHKLKKNKTYYEEFDFIPYNKNNSVYKTNKKLELNELIKKLQCIKWTEYNIDDEKWKHFYKMFGNYYPSPILAFKQFTEDNCGIFYDILFFLSRPEQPSYELLFKINSIISKSIWMKLL